MPSEELCCHLAVGHTFRRKPENLAFGPGMRDRVDRYIGRRKPQNRLVPRRLLWRDAGFDWQDQFRSVRGLVVDGVGGHNRIGLTSNRTELIQAAGEPWEIAAGYRNPQGMAGLDRVVNRPELYVKEIRLAWFKWFQIGQRVPTSGAQTSLANLHRATIGVHIGDLDVEFGIGAIAGGPKVQVRPAGNDEFGGERRAGVCQHISSSFYGRLIERDLIQLVAMDVDLGRGGIEGIVPVGARCFPGHAWTGAQ